MLGIETFSILFAWSSIYSVGIFFFAGRKCVDLVVTFKQGKGRNFGGIFTKFQKLCLHKIFNIGSTTKVNCIFLFYIQCKMHITPVSLKIIHFTIFLTDQTSPLVVSFQNKIFSSKDVYIMFMFTSWRLLERYI